MSIELLECTLRDGSYEIDFQFTSKFTGKFCEKLEKLGFPYIEIGHGMGINASEKIRKAAATDVEYAKAAESSTEKTKWGMFAIPGIAEESSIKNLTEEGMKFVRVGIDALEMRQGIEFIDGIKELGLEIYVNFMKSYALPPQEFISRVEQVINHGVHGVYLVDSAGGMLPSEIHEIGSRLSEFANITKLGFHGHDNLGLALSNSIDLTSHGFRLLDSTMQGIGRSSGNAPTEKLIAILDRMGLVKEYDVIEILKSGEELIRPKIPYAGHSGLDTMAGYVMFHTSYMDNLLEVCSQNGLDPYVLMQEHCKDNRISGSIRELGSLAEKLKLQGISGEYVSPARKYIGNEQ